MLKKAIIYSSLLIIILLCSILLKFYFLGKPLNIKQIEPYITKSTHQHKIAISYFGCAGFMITYNNESILCDPFISNPNFINFGKKYTAWTSIFPKKTLSQINMVTISHGHYDHCYDAKELTPFIEKNSKIIADNSVLNQLSSAFKQKEIEEINLNYNKEQAWMYNKDSTFRVFPIQSVHSPHIGTLEFFKGAYPTKLSQLPNTAWRWKKGEVFSYLIDIIKHDSVLYRIALINGNLSNIGVVALQKQSKQRTADLQLQIFWKEKLVTENMLQVMNITHPKEIILHHWNNFFVSFDEPIQYLRDAHLPEVLKKYNDQKIKTTIMLPFTTVQL